MKHGTNLNYFIMWTKITITVQNDVLHQICFENNGFIEFVEPYESKHHAEYLNLEITTFKTI